MDNKEDDNWLPMESNPEVMTTFLRELGLNADTYIVQDLLSVEEWAQEMLGQPVLGLVFLYEINQLQRDFEKAESAALEKNRVTDNVFFMKQYAKNACGTIALFHVVMNNLYDYSDLVREGSFFTKFAE
jgi:ubiquitin carboxyl-terminal hydrolase L3